MSAGGALLPAHPSAASPAASLPCPVCCDVWVLGYSPGFQ